MPRSAGLQRGYLGGRELATDFHDPKTGERYNPDFAAMARSAGVEGVRVDRAGDLAEAVRKGIAANRPYLIDVDIAADTNPAGAGGLGTSGVRPKQAGDWRAIRAGMTRPGQAAACFSPQVTERMLNCGLTV